ncbi:hypothetical protein [Kouleothrix sp.]|uniref:hypothetical protein n=1 Tax=Kouleothrix sp. TaxID=2779161 RepID=UPI00391C03DD
MTTIPPDGLTVTEALVLARARWQSNCCLLWKTTGRLIWYGRAAVAGADVDAQSNCAALAAARERVTPARSWGKAAQTIRTH